VSGIGPENPVCRFLTKTIAITDQSSLCSVILLRTITMFSRAKNARKRKQAAEETEAVISSDDDQKKRKARRVSILASNAASHQTTGGASVANTASAEQEDSIESIGTLIQDLAFSNNAKVDAALDALKLNLDKDKKKCDKIQAVGGCLALVQLVKNCLDKAMKKIPQCDQVTKLNKSAELTTLHKTLRVIIILTFQHEESRVGIAAIGGAEAVAKVMKTFPKCQALQERACGALLNLTGSVAGSSNVTGKKKAIESGGLQLILAAINNHLNSADVCEDACWALYNIVLGSKENTELLIFLGGGAAVAKVRTKWPNNDLVQTQVRKLVKLFAAEWTAWDDEDEA
jgi:hypothetical protein